MRSASHARVAGSVRRVLVLGLVFGSIGLHAQVDPGVRGGTIDAGGPLKGLTAGQAATFAMAMANFATVRSVAGNVLNSDGTPTQEGLGPRYNSNSCGSCHSQPAIGGTSPSATQFPFVGPNPQVAASHVNGATNRVPYFIQANGPVREARFPFFFDQFGNANHNAPNGGVEDLFTVTGRADAGACSLQQPSFNAARAANNIIFRIPTPTFGTGLMANIDDSTLLANHAAQANNRLGVSGAFNHNGNDGTISRFGWKAQNKSLMIFAGEAYNVEMGISNELFTQDRPLPGEDQMGSGLPANCLNLAGVGYPEDLTHSDGTSASTVTSDTALFSVFMQFLDQPTPSTTSPGGATSITNGRRLFRAIGCALCHTPSLTTQASHLTPGLSNATANLFSDVEIHHMGAGLADNVSQGGAGGDQFRTAPLWGLGQRIFFLHDGRTANLLSAIEAHQSSGSEATQVEEAFDLLSPSQQQDLLNFLRSL